MGGGSSKLRLLKVTVNVYDLTEDKLNTVISSVIGGGIHHSGVQIDNIEYAFGGGSSTGTGVWTQQPQRIPEKSFGGADTNNVPVCARQHDIGSVNISKKQLTQLLNQLRKEYPSSRYNLLTCNCNHFTADLCQRLGLQAPDYLNKAAETGAAIVSFGLGLMNVFGSMLEPPANEERAKEERREPEFQILE